MIHQLGDIGNPHPTIRIRVKICFAQTIDRADIDKQMVDQNDQIRYIHLIQRIHIDITAVPTQQAGQQGWIISKQCGPSQVGLMSALKSLHFQASHPGHRYVIESRQSIGLVAGSISSMLTEMR